MIERLKPYPEYKESGVRYAPSIPSSWRTLRNGSLFQQRNDTGHPELPVLEVSLKTGVRVRDFENSNRKQVMSDFSKYKRAAQGEIAYNMMRMWQGAVGVAPVDGLVSPAYVVARPMNGVDSEYYSRLFRGELYKGEIDSASRGIVKDRNRLYWEQFKQIWSLVPPPEEQGAIVRFLDHANRKIDGFIRAKRKLIALLNEQKHAIIHRAVTRGLNPDVPMKPSGLDWLGDIPAHWEVLRAKFIFREEDTRSTTGQETHLAMSQKLGLVPSDQVQSTLRSDSYVGGKLCEAGDLVLNRLKAHLGVFAVARQSGVISPDYSVFRIRGDVAPNYFESVLKSPACRRELRIRAKGIVEGFWRLYTDDFYDIRLPVPPVKEQENIMLSIREATGELNTAITRTEREISLMQEYRTRLTADIVTGKLDVRDAAAGLPDLTEEPPGKEEPIDFDDDETLEAETMNP